MSKARLILILLLVICFSLAAWLVPRREARLGGGQPSEGVLATILGDSRKMVADFFYVRADVYYHSGYYPSVFDQARRDEIQESEVSHPESIDEPPEAGFLGAPQDWIDRFSRHFRPSRHTHLKGEALGELLPWLSLSAELDPNRLQTYEVTAYWLRGYLHKSAEAEQFLREGLRANPNSPQLLYQLALIYLEDRKDNRRAEHLLIGALRFWHEKEEPKPEKTDSGEGERDSYLAGRILGALVKLEKERGNTGREIEYLKQLKTVSPQPDAIQKQIDELTRTNQSQVH